MKETAMTAVIAAAVEDPVAAAHRDRRPTEIDRWTVDDSHDLPLYV